MLSKIAWIAWKMYWIGIILAFLIVTGFVCYMPVKVVLWLLG